MPRFSRRRPALKVLHLASFDHWTGATAPAFAEVEALRGAGVDARFAYVGGALLQKKIGELSWTYPIISGSEMPWSVWASSRSIAELAESQAIDLVHAHLTHDHLLAHLARRKRSFRVVRTFHARRPMRRDPLTRRFLQKTDAVAVVNSTFRSEPLLRGRDAAFTPPPVNHAHFSPEGPDARSLYRIGREIPVVGVIGKIAHGRGFEAALEVFSNIHGSVPEARFLVIGHGYHRQHLENLAAKLGIADRVVWAGYHEDDLAEHYRAMDLMVFTAPGSDEGHRAVSEAMACGTPVISYPIAGVDDVLGDLAPELMAREASPEALAAIASRLLANGAAAELRARVAASTTRFGYEETARRLIALYEAAMQRPGP